MKNGREYSPFAPTIGRSFQGGTFCKHINDCVYRSRDGVSCDYLIKTGFSRPCAAGDCDEYEVFRPKASALDGFECEGNEMVSNVMNGNGGTMLSSEM